MRKITPKATTKAIILQNGSMFLKGKYRLKISSIIILLLFLSGQMLLDNVAAI